MTTDARTLLPHLASALTSADPFAALLQLSELLATPEDAARALSCWPSAPRALLALMRTAAPPGSEPHFHAARCLGLLLRARCPPPVLRSLLAAHRSLAAKHALGGAAALVGALEGALSSGGASLSCSAFWSLPGGEGGGAGCLSLPAVAKWPFERSFSLLVPVRVGAWREGATLLHAMSLGGAEFVVWLEPDAVCFRVREPVPPPVRAPAPPPAPPPAQGLFASLQRAVASGASRVLEEMQSVPRAGGGGREGAGRGAEAGAAAAPLGAPERPGS